MIAFRVLKLLWGMKPLLFEIHELAEQVGVEELAILVALGEHFDGDALHEFVVKSAE